MRPFFYDFTMQSCRVSYPPLYQSNTQRLLSPTAYEAMPPIFVKAIRLLLFREIIQRACAS